MYARQIKPRSHPLLILILLLTVSSNVTMANRNVANSHKQSDSHFIPVSAQSSPSTLLPERPQPERPQPEQPVGQLPEQPAVQPPPSTLLPEPPPSTLPSLPQQLHNQLSLLLVEDEVAGNSYVTTLNSGGGVLPGSPPAAIYGVENSIGRNQQLAAWFPHRNAKDILRFTQADPAQAFRGLLGSGHHIVEGDITTLTLPGPEYVNLLLSKEAFSFLKNMSPGSSRTLMLQEELQDSGQRRLQSDVSMQARIVVRRPGQIHCRDEQVEGVQGKACQIREIQLEGSNLGGDILFVLRSQLNGPNLRYRVGQQWQPMGVPVPLSEFNGSQGIEIFFVKPGHERLQALQESLQGKPLNTLLEGGFYSASRHSRGDRFGLLLGGRLPTEADDMQFSRMEVLLIDDQVSGNHYLTTLNSTGRGQQRALLYGVHHPGSGERPAVWYSSGNSPDRQQREQGQLPGAAPHYTPQELFSGFATTQGQATEAPGPSLLLAEGGWQKLLGMSPGESQQWRYQAALTEGRQIRYSHLLKGGQLQLRRPDSVNCRRETVQNIKGIACLVRAVSWQGGALSGGDLRFVIRSSGQMPNLYYRVGQNWSKVGESVLMDEFSQSQGIEVFFVPAEAGPGLASPSQHVTQPLAGRLQMKFFSASRLGQGDRFRLPLDLISENMSYIKKIAGVATRAITLGMLQLQEGREEGRAQVFLSGVSEKEEGDYLYFRIKPKNFLEPEKANIQLFYKNLRDDSFPEQKVDGFTGKLLMEKGVKWIPYFTISTPGIKDDREVEFEISVYPDFSGQGDKEILKGTVRMNRAYKLAMLESITPKELPQQQGESFVFSLNLDISPERDQLLELTLANLQGEALQSLNLDNVMLVNPKNSHKVKVTLTSNRGTLLLENFRSSRLELHIPVIKDVSEERKFTLRAKLGNSETATGVINERYKVTKIEGQSSKEQAIVTGYTNRPWKAAGETLYYRITPQEFTPEEKESIKVSYHNIHAPDSKQEDAGLTGQIKVKQGEHWEPKFTIKVMGISADREVKVALSTDSSFAADQTKEISLTIGSELLLLTLPTEKVSAYPGENIIFPIGLDRLPAEFDSLRFQLAMSDSAKLNELMATDKARLIIEGSDQGVDINLASAEGVEQTLRAFIQQSGADKLALRIPVKGEVDSFYEQDYEFTLQVNSRRSVDSSTARRQGTPSRVYKAGIKQTAYGVIKGRQQKINLELLDGNNHFTGNIGKPEREERNYRVSWTLGSIKLEEGSDPRAAIQSRMLRDPNNLAVRIVGQQGGKEVEQKAYCLLDIKNSKSQMLLPGYLAFLTKEGTRHQEWHGCQDKAWPLVNGKWEHPDPLKGELKITLGFRFDDPISEHTVDGKPWSGRASTSGTVAIVPGW